MTFDWLSYTDPKYDNSWSYKVNLLPDKIVRLVYTDRQSKLPRDFWQTTINNRFLPVGLKSNLWERQGTPYVYGSSGLSCSGGSTRNRIVGVRTHPHRVAYPTQTHH